MALLRQQVVCDALDVPSLGTSTLLFDVNAAAENARPSTSTQGIRKAYRCRQAGGSSPAACVPVEVVAEGLEQVHDALSAAAAAGGLPALVDALTDMVSSKKMPDSRTVLHVVEALSMAGYGARVWDGAMTVAAMALACGAAAGQARDLVLCSRVIAACCLALGCEGRPDCVEGLWDALSSRVWTLAGEERAASGLGGGQLMNGAAPAGSDTRVDLVDGTGEGLRCGAWEAAWAARALALGAGALRAGVPAPVGGPGTERSGRLAASIGVPALATAASAASTLRLALHARLSAGLNVPVAALAGLALAEAASGGRQAARDAIAAALTGCGEAGADGDTALALLAAASASGLTADVRGLVEGVTSGRGRAGAGKSRLGGMGGPGARLAGHTWLAAALVRGDASHVGLLVPGLGGEGHGSEVASWLAPSPTGLEGEYASPSLSSLTVPLPSRPLSHADMPTDGCANLKAAELAAKGRAGLASALADFLAPPPSKGRYRPLPETLSLLLAGLAAAAGSRVGPDSGGPPLSLPSSLVPSPSSRGGEGVTHLKDAPSFIAALQAVLSCAKGWGLKPRPCDIAAVVELHGALGNTRLGMADIRASAPRAPNGPPHPLSPVLYAALLRGLARAPSSSCGKADLEWLAVRAAEDGALPGDGQGALHAGMGLAIAGLCAALDGVPTVVGMAPSVRGEDVRAIFKVTSAQVGVGMAAAGGAAYDALRPLPRDGVMGAGEAGLRRAAVEVRGAPWRAVAEGAVPLALSAPLLRLLALRGGEAASPWAGEAWGLARGLTKAGRDAAAALCAPGPAPSLVSRDERGAFKSAAALSPMRTSAPPSTALMSLPLSRTPTAPSASLSSPPAWGLGGGPEAAPRLLSPGLWRGSHKALVAALSPAPLSRLDTHAPTSSRSLYGPASPPTATSTVSLAILPPSVAALFAAPGGAATVGSSASSFYTRGGSGMGAALTGGAPSAPTPTVSSFLAMDPWATLLPTAYDGRVADPSSWTSGVAPDSLSGIGLFLALATAPPTFEAGEVQGGADPRDSAQARLALGPASRAALRPAAAEPAVAGPLSSAETVILEEAVRVLHADSARVEASLHATGAACAVAEARLRALLAEGEDTARFARVHAHGAGGGGGDEFANWLVLEGVASSASPARAGRGGAGSAAAAYLTSPTSPERRGAHPPANAPPRAAGPAPGLRPLASRPALRAREAALRSALASLQAQEAGLLTRVSASPTASALWEGYTEATASLAQSSAGLLERTRENDGAVERDGDVKARTGGVGPHLPRPVQDALTQLSGGLLGEAGRALRSSRAAVREVVESQLGRAAASVIALTALAQGVAGRGGALKALLAGHEREVQGVRAALAEAEEGEARAGLALLALSQRASLASASSGGEGDRIEAALSRVRTALARALATRVADTRADVTGALDAAGRKGRAEAASDGAFALASVRAGVEAAVEEGWGEVASSLGPEQHARAAAEAREKLGLEGVLEEAVGRASRAAGARRELGARAKAEGVLLEAAKGELEGARASYARARAAAAAAGKRVASLLPPSRPVVPWEALSALSLSNVGTGPAQGGVPSLDLLEAIEEAVEGAVEAGVASLSARGPTAVETVDVGGACEALDALLAVYTDELGLAEELRARAPALALGPQGGMGRSAAKGPAPTPALFGEEEEGEGAGDLGRMLRSALAAGKAAAEVSKGAAQAYTRSPSPTRRAAPAPPAGTSPMEVEECRGLSALQLLASTPAY
jgi:hypothetical protein